MMPRNDALAERVASAVEANASDLLAYLVRRVDQPEDAADLLSEVFLVAWRRAASLPEDAAEARPWLFGVARRVLLHHYRRARRQRAVADRLRETLAVLPHPARGDPTEHADLHDALARLGVVDRDIIGLVHWEGLTLVEVSRVMGMKEGTVRSRYHRARGALRTQLAEVHGVGATVRSREERADASPWERRHPPRIPERDGE